MQTERLFGRIERKLGSPEDALRHLRTSKQLGGDPDLVRREELLLQAQSGAIDNILSDLDQRLIDHSEDGAEICEASPGKAGAQCAKPQNTEPFAQALR